jgi:catechol 2,3-dioxygenase-like lactoylglutathione lyase family enzyme
MADSIRLSSVAINCPNAAELAAFYADITGGRVTFANPAGHPFCLTTWDDV